MTHQENEYFLRGARERKFKERDSSPDFSIFTFVSERLVASKIAFRTMAAPSSNRVLTFAMQAYNTQNMENHTFHSLHKLLDIKLD